MSRSLYCHCTYSKSVTPFNLIMSDIPYTEDVVRYVFAAELVLYGRVHRRVDEQAAFKFPEHHHILGCTLLISCSYLVGMLAVHSRLAYVMSPERLQNLSFYRVVLKPKMP